MTAQPISMTCDPKKDVYYDTDIITITSTIHKQLNTHFSPIHPPSLNPTKSTILHLHPNISNIYPLQHPTSQNHCHQLNYFFANH